jgi:hypothetical protein
MPHWRLRFVAAVPVLVNRSQANHRADTIAQPGDGQQSGGRMRDDGHAQNRSRARASWPVDRRSAGIARHAGLRNEGSRGKDNSASAARDRRPYRAWRAVILRSRRSFALQFASGWASHNTSSEARKAYRHRPGRTAINPLPLRSAASGTRLAPARSSPDGATPSTRVPRDRAPAA